MTNKSDYHLPDKDYDIEFVVRAGSWDEVIAIFKTELDITEKRNSADRQINDLYFVRTTLRPEKLTHDFYKAVRASEKISIISDQASAILRELILNVIEPVEVQVRRLLLHISDIVEDYFRLFKSSITTKDKARDENIISKDDADPIVSHLTLDDAILILGYDLSWEKKENVPDSVMLLRHIMVSKSHEDLAKKISDNLTHRTVWDVIAHNVLKTKVGWDDIKEDLMKIKNLRNKAAHFRVVTIDDFTNAKMLSTRVLKRIEKKERISIGQRRAIIELNLAMQNILKDINTSIYANLTKDLKQIAEENSKQLADVVNQLPIKQLQDYMSDLNKSFLSSYKPDLLLKSRGFDLPQDERPPQTPVVSDDKRDEEDPNDLSKKDRDKRG